MWQARENEKHKALYKSGKSHIKMHNILYENQDFTFICSEAFFPSYVDVLDLVKCSQFQVAL